MYLGTDTDLFKNDDLILKTRFIFKQTNVILSALNYQLPLKREV
jgi:hypothetical protein